MFHVMMLSCPYIGNIRMYIDHTFTGPKLKNLLTMIEPTLYIRYCNDTVVVTGFGIVSRP